MNSMQIKVMCPPWFNAHINTSRLLLVLYTDYLKRNATFHHVVFTFKMGSE